MSSTPPPPTQIYAEEAERALAKGITTSSATRSGWLTSPLTRTLWRLFTPSLILTGVLKLAASFVQFAPPILINRMLRVLEAGAGLDVRRGYQLTLTLAATLIVKSALDNQFYHHTSIMGTQVRSLIATAVYRKSLRLSPNARQQSTVGEIVNMMQLDAARLEQVRRVTALDGNRGRGYEEVCNGLGLSCLTGSLPSPRHCPQQPHVEPRPHRLTLYYPPL